MIGVTTEPEKALAALGSEPRRRMLEAKFDRFSVEWKSDHFGAEEVTDASVQDLLTNVDDNLHN